MKQYTLEPCYSNSKKTLICSESDVLAIRTSIRSQSTLADKYKVSQSTISLIKAQRRWRHL